MSEELDKAVEDAVTQRLVEPDPEIDTWMPSGCTTLDLAISDKLCGGFPIGAVSEVSGPPSTSKSVLAHAISGACQRAGGIAFYDDVENTYKADWARLYGIDTTNIDTFRLSTGEDCPRTVEDFFDKQLAEIIKLKDDRPKIVIVDTLSAFSDAVEIKDGLDAATYGAVKAKMMSKGFRKYSPSVLAKANVGLVFINQIRDNVGGYGAAHVTSGGWAVHFYSSVRVELYKIAEIEREIQGNKIPIGVELGFKVIKNKVGPPFRTGQYRILFDYGLDNIYANLKFLKKFQPGDAKQPVEFNGEAKQMRFMVASVEKNNQEALLDEAVEKMWREVYKPSGRKPREWNA